MAGSIYRAGVAKLVGDQRLNQTPAEISGEEDDGRFKAAAEQTGTDRLALCHAAEIKVPNGCEQKGGSDNDDDAKRTVDQGDGNRWNRFGLSSFSWWPQDRKS